MKTLLNYYNTNSHNHILLPSAASLNSSQNELCISSNNINSSSSINSSNNPGLAKNRIASLDENISNNQNYKNLNSIKSQAKLNQKIKNKEDSVMKNDKITTTKKNENLSKNTSSDLYLIKNSCSLTSLSTSPTSSLLNLISTEKEINNNSIKNISSSTTSSMSKSKKENATPNSAKLEIVCLDNKSLKSNQHHNNSWTSSISNTLTTIQNLSKSDTLLRLSFNNNNGELSTKFVCNNNNQKIRNATLTPLDKLVTNSCFFQAGLTDVNDLVGESSSTQSNNQNENQIATFKSPWDLLCQIINCKVAFKKQYNGKKYNWIQLAGHAGRFKAGEREGFILKLMDKFERNCLEQLQRDVLAPYVPNIDKILFDQEDQNYYTEMQDLLYGFNNPCIMDIKIGVRTFLEDDLGEKETKPRNDLYLKLIEIDPNEPSEEEHKFQAITKRRYMTWRETSSCSSTLGFRITAIKKNQVSEKEFYSVREKKEVLLHFKKYTDGKKNIARMYLKRLKELQKSLLKSNFFYSHEIIGSSLLFVHDEKDANVWMIDFGKTRPLPDGITLTHSKPWIEGNHEDGYLIGIQSLINLFQEIIDN